MVLYALQSTCHHVFHPSHSKEESSNERGGLSEVKNMFGLKEKFIQNGVGGVYKSPPQPGAECEGKHIYKVLYKNLLLAGSKTINS
jgi:hypothetical protein